MNLEMRSNGISLVTFDMGSQFDHLPANVLKVSNHQGYGVAAHTLKALA
jgi:hypothetical protein